MTRSAAATRVCTDRLLALLEDELPAAVSLRHELHRAPELAHAETETAATIAEALGVPSRAAAGTGLVATVGTPGPGIVGVRAELDGLPIAEASGAPYAARNGAMHACGHDVHAAALVALARAVARLGDARPAPLLAIFQPSEEAYPSGADLLVRQGDLGPDVRALVAVHVHPELAWGTLGLEPGSVNASCDTVEILVTGAPTHAAYPHRGRDPVLAIASIVTAVHAQVGRRVDPLAGAVVTVGELHAGSAENAIPAQARARATLRALRPDTRDTLRELVAEVVAATAAAHGCEGTTTVVAGEPALVNDAALVARGRSAAVELGFAVAPPWRSCGADDFAFLAAVGPLAMGYVGLDGAPGFETRPLHHPEFLPPDAAVGAVTRAQAALYLAAAEHDDA
jgi:amidohydrolase